MQNPLPSGKAWHESEDAEVANVARGCSMYCGYFELFGDGEGLFWRTRVEVASDPSWVGGFQERRVVIEERGGKVFLELRPAGDMVLELS